MAGFPTLGAVTLVSGLLALELPEQAARPRPAQQQSRTAAAPRVRLVPAIRPGVLIGPAAPVFLLIIPRLPFTVRRSGVHGQACRSAASGLVREARSAG